MFYLHCTYLFALFQYIIGVFWISISISLDSLITSSYELSITFHIQLLINRFDWTWMFYQVKTNFSNSYVFPFFVSTLRGVEGYDQWSIFYVTGDVH